MFLSLRLATAVLAFGLFTAPAMAQVEATTTPEVQTEVAPVLDDQPATASYASLADAVAAHRLEAELDDETTCMAGAVYFESRGEPLSGQLAVANVILNRTRSGRFPKTICSVVTQPGQFSFVRGGRVPDIADCAYYRTAIAVARVAMAGAWESAAADALFFHARRVSPGWHRIQIAAIGNQVFYR
ncbi:cell wall hydrolase [Sphingomonas sp. AR_OL41]|jgi:spore germination cell wall hydrolase CwlJ-like protein|uniref:cell wall hydrolase n=1 Tax=Sphingomonas sp. AR_OL41 TaxID=3042729 RepID=UPI002480E133|nr:cell wall hydrolase [Sphingomonas sp. AR_OL41]MDH7973843.1 cell wall hydrolase [Sphingomonas sp. AR_OL41]